VVVVEIVPRDGDEAGLGLGVDQTVVEVDVGLHGGIFGEELAMVDPDVLAGALDPDRVAAVDQDLRQAFVSRRGIHAGGVGSRRHARHREAQVLNDDVVGAADVQTHAKQEAGRADANDRFVGLDVDLAAIGAVRDRALHQDHVGRRALGVHLQLRVGGRGDGLAGPASGGAAVQRGESDRLADDAATTGAAGVAAAGPRGAASAAGAAARAATPGSHHRAAGAAGSDDRAAAPARAQRAASAGAASALRPAGARRAARAGGAVAGATVAAAAVSRRRAATCAVIRTPRARDTAEAKQRRDDSQSTYLHHG